MNFKNMLRLMTVGFVAGLTMAGAPSIAAAQENADYRVTITLNWTADDFPHEYPQDPHFSRFIGAVHNERYTLFEDGQTATTGLGLVATNGRVSILKAEMDEMARRKRIVSVVEADALKAGAGTVEMMATLTQDHDRFSFVTMVAPSPDWITGLSGVDLHTGGKWQDAITLPLWVWDAGVDGGQTLVSENDPLPVKESLRLSAAPYFLYPTGLKPIGTVRFDRLK